MNRESFLGAINEPDLREAAARLLDAGTGRTTLYWGTSGVSIRVLCPRHRVPFTIGWLYPPGTTKFRYKTRDFTFGEEIIHYRPDLDQEVKDILEEWVNLFAEDPFTVDASSKGLAAWYVPYAEVVQYIDLLEGRLSEVLDKLHSLEQNTLRPAVLDGNTLPYNRAGLDFVLERLGMTASVAGQYAVLNAPNLPSGHIPDWGLKFRQADTTC